MAVEPKSKVQAQILDRRGEVVEVCTGADAHGDCPRAEPGGVVPCAGHVLFAQAESVHWRLALEIGDFATACPLRGFAAAGPVDGD